MLLLLGTIRYEYLAFISDIRLEPDIFSMSLLRIHVSLGLNSDPTNELDSRDDNEEGRSFDSLKPDFGVVCGPKLSD